MIQSYSSLILSIKIRTHNDYSFRESAFLHLLKDLRAIAMVPLLTKKGDLPFNPHNSYK